MIRIKLWLARFCKSIGALNASLRLVESAQGDLKRKLDRLKAEIQKATQEGTQSASQPNTEKGE